DQDARTRLLSIQSPVYNADGTNMLYMKFPSFSIPNNLVIDKKYKKPQNSRSLQSQMQNVGSMLGGMGGDPQSQYPPQMSNPTQGPALSGSVLGQSPMGQYPGQNQPP